MDEVFRNWPAVVHLDSDRTLPRDNMSLDGIKSHEALAAVWASVSLPHGVIGGLVGIVLGTKLAGSMIAMGIGWFEFEHTCYGRTSRPRSGRVARRVVIQC